MLPTMLGRAARPSGEGPATCALCAKVQGSAGLLFQKRCEGRHKGTPLMLQPHLLHTYLSAYVHTLHTYTRTHTHTQTPAHKRLHADTCIHRHTNTCTHTNAKAPKHTHLRRPQNITRGPHMASLPSLPFTTPSLGHAQGLGPMVLELCT